MAGPWAGEVFPLSKAAVIVGRMAPADVVVDDDSVSRRHAELRRSGPGYTVRDLGSANGTYIEDERCAGERPLRPGDVVKFGVVEFTYDGPPAAKKAADSATSKRKKILIGLLFVVIFMIVLGVLLKPKPPPPDDLGMKPVTDPADEIRNRDEKIFESMQRGKSFVREEQWDQAIKELTTVLDEDPINREAMKLQKKAQRELEMKRLFDEAKKKIDVGQEQEGLQKYLQIEGESAYYRRARIEVQGIAKRLSIKYRGDCKGYVGARQFEKGAEACSRYLDFNCHAGTDVEALRFLQTAEKQVKSKTYKRWTCPAELTPWLVDKKDAGVADIATELTAIYVDQDIVNALVLYAKDNKIQEAVDALRKIRKNPSKSKQHTRCDELINRLNTIYGKYTDGQGAFMGNDLKKADANYRVAWDIDQAIMPRSIKSATNRNIGQNMADGYYKVGKVLYDQGRFVDSFLTWDKGFAYRPDHPNTLSGFQLLETQARSELDAAPNCTKLTEILKYTRETPTKSPAHEAAEKMRVEQKCGN
jgi:tetratricopeptide (TPR) repeat protein